MGIQRCGAPLIRPLCQVALHLSRASCSTGEGGGGVQGGDIKPFCPLFLYSLGVNDSQPNAKHNKHSPHAKDTNST